MNTSTSHTQDSALTTKETLMFVFGGVLLIGGSFFIGRKLVKTGFANHEENKSVQTDSPANFAKRIKMAFDNDGWWGTDEDALRKTLREIPDRSVLEDVAKSYQRLYSTPMMKDMEDELTTSEYAEMANIIAAKPDKGGSKPSLVIYYQSWARRLKSAFDYTILGMPATDEDAIKSVFIEIPSQAAFNLVANAYMSEYGKNLIADLKSELEIWEYPDYMKIITSKPKG